MVNVDHLEWIAGEFYHAGYDCNIEINGDGAPEIFVSPKQKLLPEITFNTVEDMDGTELCYYFTSVVRMPVMSFPSDDIQYSDSYEYAAKQFMGAARALTAVNNYVYYPDRYED